MLILRGRTYHTRIKFNGSLYQKSLRTRNHKEAITLEAAFRTSLVRGEFGIVDGVQAGTLVEFKSRFFDHLRSKVAARSLKYYEDAFEPLVSFPPMARTKLAQINQNVIEKFVQHRLSTVMPATVNHSLRTLRRAMRLAHDWNLIAKVPKIKLLPKERQREFIIEESVLEMLVWKIGEKHPDNIIHHLVPFLVDTGLRLSEACNLLRDDIRLEPDVGFDKGWVFVEKGKSKFARRRVPLTDRAIEAVNAALKSSRSDYVWTGHGGRRKMSRHYASEIFRGIRDDLNLPWDAVLHSCRHTFCTNLASSGTDAFTIQRLAGHSSITISQKYVHMHSSAGESAITKMETTRKEQAALEKKRYDEKFTPGVVQEI
jgi:site-specific recombinase XerD